MEHVQPDESREQLGMSEFVMGGHRHLNRISTSKIDSVKPLPTLDGRARRNSAAALGVRIDKNQREVLLEEFERSGLSAAAFAREHGLTPRSVSQTVPSQTLKNRRSPLDFAKEEGCEETEGGGNTGKGAV